MSANEHSPRQVESGGQRPPNHHKHRKNRGHGRGQQRANPEQSEVNALFNKVFSFQKTDTSPWRLPSMKVLFDSQESTSQEEWNQALSDLRSKLRSIQEHLSDKEIQKWHTHTASTHRGGLVIPELKKRFHIELGTQAWCKFHEIVATRHLIPELAFNSATLHSLHICEAPGAFISSLNHYTKTHKDKEILQWKWLGTSLNPHCETNTPDCMIGDDRLILQTPDFWYFGEDNTGNVMSSSNLAGLERLVQQRMNGTVHLVTADGSVNCQDDPEHQEHRVFPLLFCQALTAFQILAAGGAFLIKMFTMYNANTACLMYLLNCAFKEVIVVKPACSKAGNSEVYVICKSFLGKDHLQPHLQTLLQHFGPDAGKTPVFNPSHLPESFVTQLEKCSEKFTNYQVAAIEENLKLYSSMDASLRQHIDRVREHCVETYIKKCHLRSARKHQKLMPNYGTKTSSMFAKNMLWDRLHGSLDEREEEGHWSWKEQLLSILRSLQQTGTEPGPAGESQRESCPKKMRSSVPVPDQQDSVVPEESDSQQTNMSDTRLGGSGDGPVESDRGLGPRPENTDQAMQAVDCDQQASAIQGHRVDSHVGMDDSAMEICGCEHRESNPVQTSSAQTGFGVAGIVCEVAAMDVGSPELLTGSSSECATSQQDQGSSAGVGHPDATQTAKTMGNTHLRSEQSDDPPKRNLDISTSHPCAAEEGYPGNSPSMPTGDEGGDSEGNKQCVLKDAIADQVSSTEETVKSSSPEIFQVHIQWIAPGKHDTDADGSWRIVTGQPLRAVFMSPFCKMKLLDKWRTVLTKAKVLQQSTGQDVRGHLQNVLSPQICTVIDGLHAKRPIPRPDQDEWYSHGMNSQELDSLHQLASTHNAVIRSKNESNPSGTLLEDVQHLLQCEPAGKGRFKSFFFKLLPTCLGKEMEPTAAELEIKQDFISACLLVMKDLQAGGSLHVWVPSLLTRFSVCIVYILSQTFDLLTLVPLQRSDGFAAPRVLINCTGFHPNPQTEKNVQRVYEHMKELHKGGSHDVLQFIPMLSLFNPDFDKPVTRFNEKLIREDLLHVVKAELALLDSADGIEHLSAEMW